jgi:hypothetical protein
MKSCTELVAMPHALQTCALDEKCVTTFAFRQFQPQKNTTVLFGEDKIWWLQKISAACRLDKVSDMSKDINLRLWCSCYA